MYLVILVYVLPLCATLAAIVFWQATTVRLVPLPTDPMAAPGGQRTAPQPPPGPRSAVAAARSFLAKRAKVWWNNRVTSSSVTSSNPGTPGGSTGTSKTGDQGRGSGLNRESPPAGPAQAHSSTNAGAFTCEEAQWVHRLLKEPKVAAVVSNIVEKQIEAKIAAVLPTVGYVADTKTVVTVNRLAPCIKAIRTRVGKPPTATKPSPGHTATNARENTNLNSATLAEASPGPGGSGHVAGRATAAAGGPGGFPANPSPAKINTTAATPRPTPVDAATPRAGAGGLASPTLNPSGATMSLNPTESSAQCQQLPTATTPRPSGNVATGGVSGGGVNTAPVTALDGVPSAGPLEIELELSLQGGIEVSAEWDVLLLASRHLPVRWSVTDLVIQHLSLRLVLTPQAPPRPRAQPIDLEFHGDEDMEDDLPLPVRPPVIDAHASLLSVPALQFKLETAFGRKGGPSVSNSFVIPWIVSRGLRWAATSRMISPDGVTFSLDLDPILLGRGDSGSDAHDLEDDSQHPTTAVS